MAFSPSEKVTRWLSVVDKYCVELKVSQSLILAMIQMESGGNPDAKRYEPAYERRYILNNKVWIERCRNGGFSTREAATSYGLMQLMFPTAWGYGARKPGELYDPARNISIGVALMASKLKKYNTKEALAAYNGGDGAVKSKTPDAWKYSANAYALYENYRAWMLAGKANKNA
jgi:soluble lytic murein transglycosylase-like protein